MNYSYKWSRYTLIMTWVMFVWIIIRVISAINTGMTIGWGLEEYGLYLIPVISPIYIFFGMVNLVQIAKKKFTNTQMLFMHSVMWILMLVDLAFYIQAVNK